MIQINESTTPASPTISTTTTNTIPTNTNTLPSLQDLQRTPPTVRMFFPTTIPSQLFNRATIWLPDTIRTARNYVIILVIIEMAISLVSFPIGFSRISVGKISDGIEIILFFTSCIGFYGITRLTIPLMIIHSIMATGIAGIFLLYLILLITFSSTTDDENRKESPGIYSAVLSTVFISNITDFIAGLTMSYCLLRIYLYEQEMKKEDANIEGRIEEFLAQRQIPTTQPNNHIPIPSLPSTMNNDNPLTSTSTTSNNNSNTSYIPPSNIWIERNQMNEKTTTIPASSTVNSSSSLSSSFSSSAGHTNTILPITNNYNNTSNSSSSTSINTTNSLICDICVDRPKTTVFYDCGHMACEECAIIMYQQFRKCHICRKIIKDTVVLYK